MRQSLTDLKAHRLLVVRLVLGLAQMGLVIASLILLAATGLSVISLTTVVLTCGVTAVSMFLFGRYSKAEKE